MIDTSSIDLRSMISTPLKKVSNTRGGEYAGPCPFCGGIDRFRFWEQDNRWSCRDCVGAELTPKDAIDFVMRQKNISFVEAQIELGLSPNGATVSKRRYQNMQDYASQHGLDDVDLQRAGWAEVTKDDRPALTFKTKGGIRYRFLDGNEPRWKSEYGFKSSWYGLSDKVIDDAKKEKAPLVICNGEISTLAARFWGVPAICVAGGGEKKIPDDLLKELNEKWDGRLAIAMDCDEHGRKAAETLKQQLGDKAAVIDLGLTDGQDLADFVKLHGSFSTREIKRKMPVPPQEPMTHREAARRTLDRLDINNVMEGKPIVIPFKTWHQFGGYAKIGWPGKLTCGVGMSGHGKTSWLNTMVDGLLKRGDSGVGIMPEFDGDEYHWDRLQRYTGHMGEPLVTAEMMMDWELYKVERKLGVAESARMGRPLSSAEQKAITRVSNEVESWPGTFELFPMNSSIEEAFQLMGDSIQDRRSRGELVSFAAFDYIQILKVRNLEDDENSYEHVLGLIKLFCMRHKIHGLVTSQVNKTADKLSRDGNKTLGTTDMRYVRDDKINLLVTLNILYDELGDMQQLANGTGYAGVAFIAKNNKGRKGRVNMVVDFEHLSWLDKAWTSNLIDLTDDRIYSQQAGD